MVLLLVITLVASSFTVYATNDTTMTLQQRFGQNDLDFVELKNVILINEAGTEVSQTEEATRARLTYEWALSAEQTELVEARDTFTLTLPEEYQVSETLSGAMTSFGTFEVSETNTITLSFDDSVKSSDDVNATFEFIADVKVEDKQNTTEIPNSLETTEQVETPEKTQLDAPSDEGMPLDKRFPGMDFKIIDKLDFIFNNKGEITETPTIDSTVGIQIHWNLSDFGESIALIKPGDSYEIT